MPRSSSALSSDQILLFPTPGDALQHGSTRLQSLSTEGTKPRRGANVVLCGSFRKDPEGLKKIFVELKDLGFSVLSPGNVSTQSIENGFVYMQNETGQSPEVIEDRHLNAIQKADFVWFFAPNGYVGPSGALEVGFARANGIPVYTNTRLDDETVQQFIETVESPSVVQQTFATRSINPPQPAIRAFQHYYRRAAHERGYKNENAKDCLLLMIEEVGEFARSLRKRHRLKRHGSPITNQENLELADIFIYVVHMANILKIDLSTVVQAKELINIQKMLNAR